MAPRTLMAMIDEWRDIDELAWKTKAYLNQGGTLPGRGGKHETESFEIHPDAF